MSNEKQENEINDLISLNEEMQTIWSEKDSEVKEILERFAAYRDAVNADSKEKDDIYCEELNKREMIIKDLEMNQNILQNELRQKAETLRAVINDVQNFDAFQASQLVDVNQLVAHLLDQFSDHEASITCQNISVKLETFIATIKEKNYTRYTSQRNEEVEVGSTEELKKSLKESRFGQTFSSSADEGTGYSILSSSDGERNDSIFADNGTLVTSSNNEYYESLEEEFVKLLQGVEEYGSDGSIDRKMVITLLEEQWSKYQLLCREKDAEIQHWMRKHKQDTNDLQSILEEQERTEAKTNESLTELQSEMEKLRQRNKFLESEIEFEKEQGEDEACLLMESFQKNLSAQLRRQSQTFLSVEESARNELAEMESKNEELRRCNEDLKRQIAEHCTEIKSWVSSILLLSEEEYSEEFNCITDVLARLQKIIIRNKKTMEELQQELNVHRSRVHEPASPADTLSQSWAGRSWNSSVDMQRGVCRNCKQMKWQGMLMGSFDMLDSVKQDEVEKFVDKLSVDEVKHRKSLKDSLELADDQLEHLQRLSRQEFGSLEILDEDFVETNDNICDVLDDQSAMDSSGLAKESISLDRIDGSNSVDSVDGLQRELEDSAGAARKGENLLDNTGQTSQGEWAKECDSKSWKKVHVSPRVLNQYSIFAEPDVEVALDSDFDYIESGGSGSNAEGLRLQDKISDEILDMDGQWLIEKDNDVHDEDQDRVQVVNLYRSLIVQTDPQHQMELVDDMSCEGEYEHQNDKVNECKDKILPFEGKSGDNREMGPSSVPRNDHFEVPKIFVEKDFNENFIQTQKQIVSDKETYDSAEYFPKIATKYDNMETPETKYEELQENAKHSTRFPLGEAENRTPSQNNILEFWTISSDPTNSIVEFAANFGEEKPPNTACIHCSTFFEKNLQNFKTMLTESIAKQNTGTEHKILAELQECKTDLRKMQKDHENLENLCEDYRSYVDEYSENLKRKNEEFRKLKLSHRIMETEIEWLREALGITRNYEKL